MSNYLLNLVFYTNKNTRNIFVRIFFTRLIIKLTFTPVSLIKNELKLFLLVTELKLFNDTKIIFLIINKIFCFKKNQ